MKENLPSCIPVMMTRIAMLGALRRCSNPGAKFCQYVKEAEGEQNVDRGYSLCL